MASSVLISNKKGDILILRKFRDDTSRQELQHFCDKVIATKSIETPIVSLNGISFLHVSAGDIVIVAASKSDSNCMMLLHFLHQFLLLLKSYFTDGEVTESSIKSNFSLVYELLDEVMDHGYPQLSDANLLKEYIRTGKQAKQLTDIEKLKQITVRATGAVSWRAEGLVYRKNEIYIDIIESVNVLLSNRGTVLKADVTGKIVVKTQLSGMPEIKFGVNDRLLMQQNQTEQKLDKGIQIDDIKFHQCVRLGKFDRDRSITFIPPDGTFDVMTYRISENISLPFKIVPVIQEYSELCKIEISVRIKAIFESS